jgi:hypothetical protein
VRKGQTLFIPILAINRSEELWGGDAREFKYVFKYYVLPFCFLLTAGGL